jgi:nitroreductase
MELRDAVRRRRMVRAYHPDRPVPDEVVQRMLEHATQAPSAGFSQGWDFLVLDAPEDRDLFWRTTATQPDDDGPDSWLRGLVTAPLLILCLSHKQAYLDRYAEPDKGFAPDDEGRWSMPYWHVDTGMAALLMLLTAVDEGLGSCFFGVPKFRQAAVLAAFGVPEGHAPVGVLSVGYAAPDKRSPSLRRGRRGVADVAHRGRWGTPLQ